MALPVLASSGAVSAEAVSSSMTLGAPSGVQAGDLLVAVIRHEASSITLPSGWAHADASPTPNVDLVVAYKWATGTDSYAFTFGSSAGHQGRAFRITGAVGSGNPFEGGNAAEQTSFGVATTPNVSLTTTGPDRLLFFAAGSFGGGTATTPAGFTEVYDNGSGCAADTKAQASAGSTGNLATTFGANGPCAGWIGAILPVAAASSKVPVFMQSYRRRRR